MYKVYKKRLYKVFLTPYTALKIVQVKFVRTLYEYNYASRIAADSSVSQSMI